MAQPDKDKSDRSGPPVLAPGKTTVFEKPIDTNLALTVCYLPLGIVSLAACVLVFMSKSDNNRLARYHAVQAALIAVLVLVVTGVVGVVGAIPFIGILAGLLQIVIAMGYFIFSAKMAYEAFRGKDVKLPLIGSFAEEFSK